MKTSGPALQMDAEMQDSSRLAQEFQPSLSVKKILLIVHIHLFYTIPSADMSLLTFAGD